MSRLRAIRDAIVGPLTTERDYSLSELLGQEARYRTGGRVGMIPTQDTALRNSVWWGALMLKANVISSFPMDVMKPIPGAPHLSTQMKPPPVIQEPFPGIDRTEWLFGTSIDLDRYGNSIGIIRGRNAFGLVTQLEPVRMDAQVRAVIDPKNDSRIKAWRIGHDEYQPEDIWHEKRYTVKGVPLGLSPLAYAAYTMGIYNSAQQFALDWFGLGASPRGVLKNTRSPVVKPEIRDAAKDTFKAATMNGDIFVTGTDWEWTPAAADQMSPNFLAQQESSSRDICRYLGVPASMLDVEISTGNITYANVTMANLQWLITSMGPDTYRMERYWSAKAVPKPWTVKMNTAALLRMDPQTQTLVFAQQLGAKVRTPTEVRALDNLPPYTPEQLAELEQFASMGKSAPVAPAERNLA